MNTLNYIGSKHTLSSTIINIISNELTNLNDKSFLDLFAGTGSISYRFQDLVQKCGANDLEYYSFVINNALIKCSYSEKLANYINKCNLLVGVKGLTYNNYSINDKCERMFFTNANSQRCDAIREYIETIFKSGEINQNEYYFLLGSLLVSIDKMANTSCVYGAYLKEWKNSALKDLLVTPIHQNINIKEEINTVYNLEAEQLSVLNEYYDIVYMDPPYNQRQYSANYCPLNYIAKYDSNIVLKGKTGLIDGYNKSKFCSKLTVKNAFKTLLDNLKCKYIFISYNNEGLLDCEELKKLLSNYGELKLYKIEYKKFKANKNVSGDKVYEYLWYINKTTNSDLIEEIEYIINT